LWDDLNLWAKLLMLFRSIPAPKRIPSNLFRSEGTQQRPFADQLLWNLRVLVAP
jgi:hypothetical protein